MKTQKNIRFLVNRTYDTITLESAENGDTADSGFIYEDREFHSIRDVLEEIRSLGCIDFYDDFSFYPADGSIDYRTGEETREAVHVNPRTPEALKAWLKTLEIVNLS